MRWLPPTESKRVHMAVEGSVGGTTIGLHMAADVIDGGGRVLWIGLAMPNPDRFPQLFSHLSPVAASRFHAMLIAGALDKAVDSIISAAANLPSVELVVLDDWCEHSGRIPKRELELISKLGTKISKDFRLLLISKGTVDASGQRQGQIFARAENYFSTAGYDIWTLSRSPNGHHRILAINSEEITVRITDNGIESIH